jgi:hypothetical protein
MVVLAWTAHLGGLRTGLAFSPAMLVTLGLRVPQDLLFLKVVFPESIKTEMNNRIVYRAVPVDTRMRQKCFTVLAASVGNTVHSPVVLHAMNALQAAVRVRRILSFANHVTVVVTLHWMRVWSVPIAQVVIARTALEMLDAIFVSKERMQAMLEDFFVWHAMKVQLHPWKARLGVHHVLLVSLPIKVKSVQVSSRSSNWGLLKEFRMCVSFVSFVLTGVVVFYNCRSLSNRVLPKKYKTKRMSGLPYWMACGGTQWSYSVSRLSNWLRSGK